ncbi:hypothetical protein K438DRAFT_1762356 [Mycena galopus ATCC 62051]|nr:hypothetical protein K438DRAFT_1762356 [Mycena galopus ATCC 62051]
MCSALASSKYVGVEMALAAADSVALVAFNGVEFVVSIGASITNVESAEDAEDALDDAEDALNALDDAEDALEDAEYEKEAVEDAVEDVEDAEGALEDASMLEDALDNVSDVSDASIATELEEDICRHRLQFTVSHSVREKSQVRNSPFIFKQFAIHIRQTKNNSRGWDRQRTIDNSYSTLGTDKE